MKLIWRYRPIYPDLYDKPPYSGILSDIFEMSTNKNLRCCHGNKNYDGDKKVIIWVSKNIWKMFH